MTCTAAVVSVSHDTVCSCAVAVFVSCSGAVHMGVVTQTNSLWDRLSVENHLFLFARLRGVSEALVKGNLSLDLIGDNVVVVLGLRIDR